MTNVRVISSDNLDIINTDNFFIEIKEKKIKVFEKKLLGIKLIYSNIGEKE